MPLTGRKDGHQHLYSLAYGLVTVTEDTEIDDTNVAPNTMFLSPPDAAGAIMLTIKQNSLEVGDQFRVYNASAFDVTVEPETDLTLRQGNTTPASVTIPNTTPWAVVIRLPEDEWAVVILG